MMFRFSVRSVFPVISKLPPGPVRTNFTHATRESHGLRAPDAALPHTFCRATASLADSSCTCLAAARSPPSPASPSIPRSHASTADRPLSSSASCRSIAIWVALMNADIAQPYERPDILRRMPAGSRVITSAPSPVLTGTSHGDQQPPSLTRCEVVHHQAHRLSARRDFASATFAVVAACVCVRSNDRPSFLHCLETVRFGASPSRPRSAQPTCHWAWSCRIRSRRSATSVTRPARAPAVRRGNVRGVPSSGSLLLFGKGPPLRVVLRRDGAACWQCG